MKSNGLILLVIVAIWAVYLVQHWVRRRENLATARSVDRFSEAMRVLERRRPATALAQHAGLVLHAEADRRDDRRDAPVVSVKPSRPALRAGSTVSMKHSASAHDEAPSTTSGRRWQLPQLGRVSPQQIKAGALASAAIFFILAVALTPMGALPWWTPLLALVAVGGVVAWLRSDAVRRAQSPSASTTTAPARPAVRRSETVGQRPTQAARPVQAKRPAAPQDETREVFDVNAPSSTVDAEIVQPAEQPAEVGAPAPGSWAPVAVPPPTYTLKARADRAEREPAATTPTTAERSEPGVTMAQKYADTPVEDLPFDGMVLDADLEDLPSVHRSA